MKYTADHTELRAKAKARASKKNKVRQAQINDLFEEINLVPTRNYRF